MSIPWWKFDKMLADRYRGEPLKPIIDLVSERINELVRNPKPPRVISAGGLVETFCGHPLEDILDGIPVHRKPEALAEMRRMSSSIGAFGGGNSGGIVFPGQGQASSLAKPFNHIEALCMRMRWANIFSTPFEDVYVHPVPSKKVFIFIITKELKTVTLDVDDDGLYPSDHLIAQIRTLGG
jgi:hypothetical protein